MQYDPVILIQPLRVLDMLINYCEIIVTVKKMHNKLLQFDCMALYKWK